jgi:hypothetical protein
MITALPKAAGTSAFHAGLYNGDEMDDPIDVEIPKTAKLRKGRAGVGIPPVTLPD